MWGFECGVDVDGEELETAFAVDDDVEIFDCHPALRRCPILIKNISNEATFLLLLLLFAGIFLCLCKLIGDQLQHLNRICQRALELRETVQQEVVAELLDCKPELLNELEAYRDRTEVPAEDPGLGKIGVVVGYEVILILK